MDSRHDALVQFIQDRCLVRKEGIKLASGRTTNFYLDCRVATMDPNGLKLIAELVLETIDALPDRPVALGGTVVGAVPITAAVVVLTAKMGKLPLTGFMVRKEVKEHGLQKKVENAPAPGSRVAIVEDVVTSGGSTIAAIDAAEAEGLVVAAVIPVVDRGEGGAEAIRERVPRAVYAPLVKFDDLSELKPTTGA